MAKDRGFDIGFHAGIGGNRTNIGEFMRDLTEAGIEFFMKSVDDYGIIHEALINWVLPYGVDHNLVFRLAAERNGVKFDVPNYNLNPADAAREHWENTLLYLPPEFKGSEAAKDHVWLEVINEVDKNRSEWIAEFAIEISKLMLAQGFRPMLFGWSSGEPEPEHWRGPKMLEFLRFASQNPGRVGVALHEYSLDDNDLFNGYPYKVGRFKDLLAACDEHGIPYPPIGVTEFGWGAFSVPEVSVGLPQLEEASRIYYEHEAVLGAAIWFLGGGWQQIADKAQRYILPALELALSFNYWRDLGDTTPPPPPPSDDCNFDDSFTKFHILRPKDMNAAQWDYVVDLMDNGIAPEKLGLTPSDLGLEPGQEAPIGYEGWSHVDAIVAIKRAIEAGYTKSRLVVVDGHFIGTGLDSAWMKSECPDLAPYTVYLRSDGASPDEITIHDIVNELPHDPNHSYSTRPLSDITTLVVHHTTGDPFQPIENIASYHVNGKGWPGIAYHFVIDGGGKIYMTNYPETLSYHSNYANPYAMAICMQGNFTYDWPSEAQLESCRRLIEHYKSVIPTITRVIPHRYAPGAATQCPGNTWEQWWDIVTDTVTPPPEPAVPVKLGLHASADPGLAAGELDMMRVADVEVIKVLSNMRKEDVSALSNAFPGIPFIVRAFLDFGGRNVTAREFFDWTYPDVQEIINRLGQRDIWVELHNEPNLYAEGLGSSWAGGYGFNTWLTRVLELYKGATSSQSNILFLYPGLSPGDSITGIRQSSSTFADQSINAALDCDGVGVHNYWSSAWPMSRALEQLDAYLSKFGSKVFWITEASNNKPESESVKASEYIAYAKELSTRNGVAGVTYFVASSSNPAWGWGTGGSGEVWLNTSIPQIVGNR